MLGFYLLLFKCCSCCYNQLTVDINKPIYMYFELFYSYTETHSSTFTIWLIEGRSVSVGCYLRLSVNGHEQVSQKAGSTVSLYRKSMNVWRGPKIFVCANMGVNGFFLAPESALKRITDGIASRWYDILYIITDLGRSRRSSSEGKFNVVSKFV